MVVGGGVFTPGCRRLADLALRLPTIFTQREHVEAGGLVSYRERDFNRRAAFYYMWTNSSRAQNPPTCRSSNRRGSSSPSTARPPARSASPSGSIALRADELSN